MEIVTIDSSILESVKNAVGGGSIHEYFDQELIEAINSVFVELRQNGIGPEEGFLVTGESETWRDFVGDNYAMLGSLPNFVSTRVRMKFDPPTSSAVREAYEKETSEDLFRLNLVYEIGI